MKRQLDNEVQEEDNVNFLEEDPCSPFQIRELQGGHLNY